MWRVVLTGYSSTTCLTRIMPNLISSGIIRCIYYSNFEIVWSIFLETLTKFSEKKQLLPSFFLIFTITNFFLNSVSRDKFFDIFWKNFRLVLWIYLNRNLMRWMKQKQTIFLTFIQKNACRKDRNIFIKKVPNFSTLNLIC